jgi:hypothetical protein
MISTKFQKNSNMELLILPLNYDKIEVAYPVTRYITEKGGFTKWQRK